MTDKFADTNDAREEFYQRLATHNMAPLWSVLDSLVTSEPETRCLPAIWHYQQVRPFIAEAGDLISAEEAERRVLILENPGMPGESRITQSLYAGLQLILPGEVAPAHRHTQSALRFVVEGQGAYTAVNGERTEMCVGDFVITPSWSWHDHGNETEQPMVWLDGLDIPIARFLGVSFAEKYQQQLQQPSLPVGNSQARYGNGLLPVNQTTESSASPVFNYPYARTRESLLALAQTDELHPAYGIKLKYSNPITGDFAIPTMGTFMQWMPAGFNSRRYRSTDSCVYSVVEGSGRTRVGGLVLEWQAQDTFVIPGWVAHQHECESDAMLFSFSDRPVQQKLGLWREQIDV